MKLFLRLGCALLACAGIAVSRGAAAPADETPAHQRAQERLAGADLEASHPELSAPADASARPPRRAGPSFRFVAAAGGRGSVLPSFVFEGRAARSSDRPVLALLVGGASPRGPPASA